jgi:hypothetical protein
MRKALKGFALTAVGVLCIGVGSAQAATTEEVVESDVVRQVENSPPTNDWVLYTRAGTPPTAGAFVTGPGTPPLGDGSFQTTTATGAEKVFLFNYEHIGTDLADVDDIGYSTYRTAGSGSQLPGLNLQVDYNGPDVAGGFTTLVFEPIYNTAQGAVVNNTWQSWTADASGRWWSTAAINGQCAGAAVACMRTWSQIVANNPDATIVGGVGVNQGSGNGGLIAATDAFTFDETTYDFENDTDGDGVGDGSDNCVNDANPGQEDLDGDGQGDACDADDDNDGVNDGADNCATTPNPDQSDNDNDGIGTACDSTELPTSKDECKNGGWQAFNGTATFRNQGDCVSYVATQGKNPPGKN